MAQIYNPKQSSDTSKKSHLFNLLIKWKSYIVPIEVFILGCTSTWLVSTCNKRVDEEKVSSDYVATNYVGDEVKVGRKYWMGQNLDVVKYNDGTKLEQASNPDDWKRYNEENTGCYYDNGKNKFYNFAAIFDTKHGGIIPRGFRPIQINDIDNTRRDSISASDVKTVSGWKNRVDGTSGNGKPRINANIIAPTGYITSDFHLVGADSVFTSWSYNSADENRDINGKATRWFFIHIQSEGDSINYDHQNIYCGYPVRCIRE